MTPDEYVASILKQHEASSSAMTTADMLKPPIKEWAGSYWVDTFYSGSYAKGTAVKGTTDIDLFISLANSTPDTLRDIYDSLFDFAERLMWNPRRQNVSIGVTFKDTKIDLVPGKIQLGYRNFHSLYRRCAGTWIQTNVAEHIKIVGDSKRTNEIRAIKIWRNCHQLDFPSFYLELIVLRALHGHSTYSLASNVVTALQYIADSIPIARVIDPINTNNIVSDDLAPADKQVIAMKAQYSLQRKNWNDIIW